MIAHMNARQFKKLCKLAHGLMLQFDPNCASSTYRCEGQGSHDGWHHFVLKGTLGFGGSSGHYQPEWSDQSAWSVLFSTVFWSFCEKPDWDAVMEKGCMEWPSWRPGMRPRRWQDVIALGRKMVAAQGRQP